MERNQVEQRFKWNMDDIFPSDEAWEKAYAEAEKEINFSQYAGKLGNRSDLLAFLKANDEFLKKVERVFLYASMKHDEDTRISKYTAYSSKCDALISKYSAELAFFEPELASQTEEYLNSLVADKDFSDYDYTLKTLIKRKPHVIPEAEERLVALAGETLGSFSDIFSMIDNADLPLPEIELDGKNVKLTHGTYGVILHSSDREKRKEAYEKYYGAYESLLNTITATYYGNVKKDVFLTRAYHYNSCLERALSSEDVNEVVYRNLLTAVKGSFPAMHRYIADRKKILGYDKLYFYDVYAPLVSDVEVRMEYDDAYDYVIKGLAPLGKEYQALLKRGHDERWIDVEETEGKRSGAYSTGCFGVHPYVLLNYKPTINEIFTVAHEMGHSLHTYFSSHNQPYAKSDYKIFVAEVASTVNEVLLLKFMLGDTDDINLRKYLLNYYLDTIRATLHRQTMFAEFEYEAHDMAEKGEPLTKELLCEIYGRIGKDYYGESIEHDFHISCEWARIPHFYRAFYVYKYSTGIITAMNIAHRILTEGEPAVKDYFKFLSSGSSSDPVSLLRLAGVDLESTAPFEFAMKEFADTLAEFEKLMNI
ncbi:MAG TPA: oligoendopeptidase F [Candidatus Coproplasma stercoripullorum]|uniref:Oligopeptidase F n=1 Tax=Candidatus Coproplasma stercoripullorum TaxID=2840751 RepID=A0A9D1DBG8_9FIRM|nr:oligoendopeptidase F [Candidatus Coproplasma stercoripullorum]